MILAPEERRAPCGLLLAGRLVVMVHALPHLYTIGTLEERGIGFRSLQEQMDTTASGGKLGFHVLERWRSFERDLIRERTQAGLAAARARGRLGGRPKALDERKEGRQGEMFAESVSATLSFRSP